MKSNSQMTFWQHFQLAFLWGMCRGFSAMPYWLRYYVVENIIFFVLYYCLRYRMRVVKENLSNSFPEKSKLELLIIRRKFYRTLAEVFIDTVSLAGMNEDKIRSQFRFRNLEQHCANTAGVNWIAMMAHFGCWEYGAFWNLYDPTHCVVSVYHPLRSVVMEEFYQRLRNHHHSIAVSMSECLRFCVRHCDQGYEGRPLALGLIADQNPPRRPDSHWFRFLNQDTIFFDGGEKLALRYGLPVYFTHTRRIRRGFYEMNFEQIYDGHEQVAENEITERYVRRLEAMIRESPELWMWSHRRWKHKR